jgi:UPF0271 protein
MARTLDLNADVGEGFDDDGLYPLVSSVSIACGGHAGDERSMTLAIRAAKSSHVRIGAHPSYPDRDGWGRRTIDITLHDLRVSILEQLDALMRVADGMRASITHCKLHGALYNDSTDDPVLAGLIAETIADRHPELRMIAMAGGALVNACVDAGLDVAGEAFADRAYRNGHLVPRSEPGAVISDPAVAAAQALGFVNDPLVQTICIHGDTPDALTIAMATRRALESAGVEISSGV